MNRASGQSSGSDISTTNQKVWNAVAIQDNLSSILYSGRSRCKQKKKRVPAGSKTDSGTAQTCVLEIRNSVELTNLEYDQYFRNLTLPQKLGLLEKPSPPLTEDQWELVKKQSDSRKDGYKLCSICLENFGSTPQVILSCSHVYHQQCLKSFETFFQIRTCPLCRKDGYYKRVHDSGIRAWRESSATIIQRNWRAYSVRKSLMVYIRKKLRDSESNVLFYNYNALISSTAPRMRRRYGAKAVRAFTRSLVQNTEKRSEEIDKFIEDTEASVTNSIEEIDSLYEDLIRSRSQALQNSTESDALAFSFQSSNWAMAEELASNRASPDCPICCQQLYDQSNSKCEKSLNNSKCEKSVYLLSCSHAFHGDCITSFERFKMFQHLRCPVCRSEYSKKIWFHK